MVIGTGIDIVEVSRIKKAALKWKGSFLNKTFTSNEIAYARNKASIWQHLASRFAAKEAILKAFGKATEKGLRWTDIEIKNKKSGEPTVRLSGRIKKIKAKIRGSEIIISLSHTRTYAIASAILITNPYGPNK